MTHPKISPSGRQVRLSQDQFIVSKTDLKGHILYANRVFMRLSGFSEAALLGQPHRVIRHPDMPRGVFRLMWTTLQQEQEFFGFVKNLCSNGDHYWVLAHVVPERDAQHRVVGYSSFRRCPPDEAIQTISALYARMCAAEQSASRNDAPDAGLAVLNQHLSDHQTDYERFVFELLNVEAVEGAV